MPAVIARDRPLRATAESGHSVTNHHNSRWSKLGSQRLNGGVSPKQAKRRKAVTVRTIQFLAIAISALALVPSGAHLAALPNKIGMSQAEYFTVQRIYYGWAFLGVLWPAGLLVNAVLATVVRSQQWPFWFAVMAALSFGLMLAIFFLWTFPANQATENWTSAPENWEALRRQWEYSHAVNAVILFMAICFSTISALSWRTPGS
jgi:hypothetical protein